jgi:hypothetical protein
VYAFGDASLSSGIVTFIANDTNDCLQIQYTPAATAGSTTVTRVAATVQSTNIQ